ncbi:MAG: LuxR C-terminal-related transcriptional regulator [Eubacteriales bacterium]|nr:LuxR C-terminal-related transcriptional regulator [Eubacteriales bacterium]
MKMTETSRLQVDRGSIIQKEIERFPSIYLEGAACCGKTTAARMFLRQAADANFRTEELDLQRENDRERLPEVLAEMLVQGTDAEDRTGCCLFLDNYSMLLPEKLRKRICDTIGRLPKENHILLAGREKPDHLLLELLWHGEMGMITQPMLAFTEKELRSFLKEMNSRLSSKTVYAKSGGWPGIAALLPVLEKTRGQEQEISVSGLLTGYEMQVLLQEEILGSLSEDEKYCVQLASLADGILPYALEKICSSENRMDAGEDLERKGIFYRRRQQEKFFVWEIFRPAREPEKADEMRQMIARLYEEQENLQEAGKLWEKLGGKEWKAFCLRHYTEIPFLSLNYRKAGKWEEKGADHRLLYLKGMLAVQQKNQKALQTCIQKLQKMKQTEAREAVCNLQFASPWMSGKDWFRLLEESFSDEQKCRLYHPVGSSVSCLWGLRDMAFVFADLRREQNRYTRIWKKCLERKEQAYLEFARAEYLAETFREKEITQEHRERLQEYAAEMPEQYVPVLAKINGQLGFTEEHAAEKDREKQGERLMQENEQTRLRFILAKAAFAGPIKRQKYHTELREVFGNNLAKWSVEGEFYPLFAYTRLLLREKQYAAAEQILDRIRPEAEKMDSSRIIAEILFMQAIVHHQKKQYASALRETAQSFAISDRFRYGRFYTEYDETGSELLHAYLDSQKQQEQPHVKRKSYHYSNILQAPETEYLRILIRKSGRQMKQNSMAAVQNKERLTPTEKLLLADLEEGLSNKQIAEKHSLEISTVKTHLQHLYKKLGVSSRTKAVFMGKKQELLG